MITKEDILKEIEEWIKRRGSRPLAGLLLKLLN
jgi:hypothetical protein